MATVENRKQIRLLIVEDDDVFRGLLERDFSEAGFEVKSARGGERALEICRESSPDVILSGIRMSKGLGSGLMRSLRETFGERAPAVICLANHMHLSEEGASLRGADALFPKRLDGRELVAAVRHFVGERAQRLRALRAAA